MRLEHIPALAAAALPRATAGRLLGEWHPQPGWTAALALVLVGYLLLWLRASEQERPRAWRLGCFVLGVAIWWMSVTAGVNRYTEALFWVHMVIHLTLIMVVPCLLVLGHPLTTLLAGAPSRAGDRLSAMIRSKPVGALTLPWTGLVIYAVVVVATHLTGFLDQAVAHPWLFVVERLLYVGGGFAFFLPILGEEPLRSRASYLTRVLVLVVAMLPDTIVGVVLLQSDQAPFPRFLRDRPSWALAAVDDMHVGGALMWAGGDGLMMLVAVGLVISVVTSPQRRDQVTGAWLEDIRAQRLREIGSPDDAETWTSENVDSDEALDRYNRMLEQLRHRGDER